MKYNFAGRYRLGGTTEELTWANWPRIDVTTELPDSDGTIPLHFLWLGSESATVAMTTEDWEAYQNLSTKPWPLERLDNALYGPSPYSYAHPEYALLVRRKPIRPLFEIGLDLSHPPVSSAMRAAHTLDCPCDTCRARRRGDA